MPTPAFGSLQALCCPCCPPFTELAPLRRNETEPLLQGSTAWAAHEGPAAAAPLAAPAPPAPPPPEPAAAEAAAAAAAAEAHELLVRQQVRESAALFGQQAAAARQRANCESAWRLRQLEAESRRRAEEGCGSEVRLVGFAGLPQGGDIVTSQQLASCAKAWACAQMRHQNTPSPPLLRAGVRAEAPGRPGRRRPAVAQPPGARGAAAGADGAPACRRRKLSSGVRRAAHSFICLGMLLHSSCRPHPQADSFECTVQTLTGWAHVQRRLHNQILDTPSQG